MKNMGVQLIGGQKQLIEKARHRAIVVMKRMKEYFSQICWTVGLSMCDQKILQIMYMCSDASIRIRRNLLLIHVYLIQDEWVQQ